MSGEMLFINKGHLHAFFVCVDNDVVSLSVPVFFFYFLAFGQC